MYINAKCKAEPVAKTSKIPNDFETGRDFCCSIKRDCTCSDVTVDTRVICVSGFVSPLCLDIDLNVAS